MRYHNTPNGTRKCDADPSNPRSTGCQYDEHFDSREEAEAAYEKQMGAEHGAVASLSKAPKNKVAQYEKTLENADNPSDPRYDDTRNKLYRAKKQEAQSEDSETVSNNGLVKDLQEPDGGATLDVNSQKYIESGFAYSPYPEHSRSVPLSQITQDDVAGYIRDKQELLKQPGHNLGVWHDPETSQIYLDISVVSDDAKEARQGCADNDQIAFFDMQTFTSVDVDRTAKSGQKAS